MGDIPLANGNTLLQVGSAEPGEVTQGYLDPFVHSVGFRTGNGCHFVDTEYTLFFMQGTDLNTANVVTIADQDAVILSVCPPFRGHCQRPSLGFQYIHQHLLVVISAHSLSWL